MDLSLSGRAIDSAETLRSGLVSRVCDDPRAVATEIAGNDTAAVSVLKRRLRYRRSRAARADAEVAAFETLLEANADRLRTLDE